MQLRHQILLASITVSMVVTALVSGPLLYDRAQRLAAADRDSRDTAHAMAEHAARSLNPLEILLAEDAEALSRELTAGTLIPGRAHLLLARHRTQMPQLAETMFIVETGDIYAASLQRSTLVDDFDFADCLAQHRDNPDLGMLVDGPVIRRSTGRPAITVSTRIADATGAFRGAVVALLDPEYFTIFYDAAGQSEDHALALVHLDGRVLAAATQFPGAGERLEMRDALLAPLHGIRKSSGPVDLVLGAAGSPPIRATAFRVPGWPLAVIDTVQPSVVLAGWRTLASIMAGATALFLLCVAGLTWFGLRSIYREECAKQRLAESRDQLALHAGELERTARALVIAKAEAERANRHKSEFLASMSHELRTPLNAINGFSEIIRDETLGAERQATYREYAAHIHDAGQLLLSLINDVLDLAKIEAGRMQLRVEPVDAAAAATASVDLMKAAAQARSIALELQLAPHLDPLQADARALRQILVNLLSNAVKFTKPGGRVSVGVAGAAGGIEIVVSDTGIGMSAEETQIAMQEFGQVDGPFNRSQPGTGLGLPLTKRLVELHGGRFTLESTPGQGTTATVWLPQEALRAAA